MSASMPTRIAVLVSGSGSNLQAIIDRIEAGDIKAIISCVISNKPDSLALVRAGKHGIPTFVLENNSASTREEYDCRLVETIRQAGADLVVLAGFMRIITHVMVDAFPNAIMNIHPALLPAFPGLNAQRQALAHGVRISGCTVHFVDLGTDTGPIILQSVVPVEQHDTVATLTARIQEAEHRTYPQAIKLFTEGRIQVEGRRVLISEQ